MSDHSEIKSLVETLGQDWEEFKKTNDQLLKGKADGKAVADLEAKLDRVNTGLDKVQGQLDEIEKRANRPVLDAGDAKALATEVKSFNVSRGEKAKPVGEKEYLAYKSAYWNFIRAGGNVDILSDDERKAMSWGTDSAGGYLLPPPTVNSIVELVRNDSAIRQIADVVTISTNSIEGLVDRGSATSGWVGERASRTSSTTPTLGHDRIDTAEMYAYPELTQQLLDDAAVDVEAWLAAKVARSFYDLETTGFFTGNGVTQPRGLTSYSTAATADATRTWGTFEHVATSNNGDFPASNPGDTLIDVTIKLKIGYHANARWLMTRGAQGKIRKFKEATTNAYIWQPGLGAGMPAMILGYPVVLDENMPALATDSLSVAFGDFRRGFQIVDRMGMRTIRDNLTNKPYVGLYVTKRVGSAARDFDAIKFVKFGS